MHGNLISRHMEVVCANLGHVSIGIYERKSEWNDIYQLRESLREP
jgi:hypothetical protein